MRTPPKPSPVRVVVAAVALAVTSLAGSASSQLPGGVHLPQLPSLQPLDPARTLEDIKSDLSPMKLADLRQSRLDEFVRVHRKSVETDPAGQPVMRGEVLAIDPTPETLAAIQASGFVLLRQDRLEGLDIDVVVLAPQPGWSDQKAIRRLRKIDPSGDYEYDHIYFQSGAVPSTGAKASAPAGDATGRSALRIGLIDTGVDASHPTLRQVAVEQRGFAHGGPTPRAHGTATASLISGSQDAFQGAAPGAGLLVADVYGSGDVGGDAESLARALAWMAKSKIGVINISLAGPDNRLLAAAVRAVQSRGQVVVAAVGNDGPAAPPVYPASYPGVVAVSAVDARGRLLFEDGRAAHVDFCAPGADMAAAAPGGKLVAVRGTSFATPLISGLLARRLEADPAGGATAALAALARIAVAPDGDLRACGHGVLARDLRLDPNAAKGRRPQR